jgi:hypothetical protein
MLGFYLLCISLSFKDGLSLQFLERIFLNIIHSYYGCTTIATLNRILPLQVFKKKRKKKKNHLC